MRWRELRPILMAAGVEARTGKGDDWILKRGPQIYCIRVCDGRDIGPMTLADVKRKFQIDAL